MAKLGKRLQAAAKAIDNDKVYELAEAVKLVKDNAKAKNREDLAILVIWVIFAIIVFCVTSYKSYI